MLSLQNLQQNSSGDLDLNKQQLLIQPNFICFECV